MMTIEQVARLAVDWAGQSVATMTPDQRAMYDLALAARFDLERVRADPLYTQLVSNMGNPEAVEDLLARWLNSWEEKVSVESVGMYQAVTAYDAETAPKVAMAWVQTVAGWCAVAACLGLAGVLALRGCGV